MTNDKQQFFSTLNSFFDHIYVITLERFTDRHQHIRQELDGLQYELFFGKDKTAFTLEDLKAQGVYDEKGAIAHHRYGKPMVAGMIGCSWSHKAVYEDMIAMGYQTALILEDDVVIDTDHMEVLPKALTQLPKEWELFYLGYAHNEKAPPIAPLKKAIYHLQHAIGLLNFSHTTIYNLYPRKVSEHIAHSGYHDQTHAYAITLSAAHTLKDLQEPISFIADNLLAHAVTNELVKGYICQPKLINQQSQAGHTAFQSYVGD